MDTSSCISESNKSITSFVGWISDSKQFLQIKYLYFSKARDLAGFTCEVAWYHKLEDSLAYQQAGNLLHATQIASKVQKRCIRRKIFHSQCNAISQTSQKEFLLCRNTPKNVAKQEKYATLYLISRQKRCFRHPSQNPPAKPPHLPSHSRDFISFWYPAYKHAGIWHACMPIPLRVYQRERRRNTKKI